MSKRIKQHHKFPYSIKLTIFGIFFAAAAMSKADSEELQLSLLTESEYLGEVPTVVTATRMPQLQSEAPAAVTVIDAETIKASGVRSLADLMLLVPGFQVGRFNSAQPVVTYHGLSDQYPRHMQILVDGRSIYSPIFRGAFWMDLTIAIEDIERIEVIRGPNTVTYGSNAFFGVINIITLHASQQTGTYVKGVAGNNGVLDATFRHAWRAGEHNFRLTGAFQEDDGFESRFDDTQVKFLNFTGDMRLSAVDTLEIDIGVNENTSIEDFRDSSVPLIPATREVSSHYQQLRWHRAISLEQEFHIQFFHQYREQALSTVTEPIDFSFLGLGVLAAPLDEKAREHRYDLEFQHNIQSDPGFQFVWGAGSRLDEMYSLSFFGDNRKRLNRVQRLFSSFEWHATKKLVLNAGAIYENSDVAGDDISPRIAVNYHLDWGDTIRASISRATRMPSLVEQEGNRQFWLQDFLYDQNILGIGGLVTEKIATREIAYLGKVRDAALSWGVRVYQDKITDRITEIRIPISEPEISPEQDAFSYVNTGEIEVFGQELELEYRPTNALRFLFNYAHMKADTSDFDLNYSLAQNQETLERSVPDYSSHGTMIVQFTPEWMGTLMVGQVDNMEWLGDGSYLDRGTQRRIDINIAKEFKIRNTFSRLALTLHLDEGVYADFRLINIPGRKYYLTLDMQF